MCVGCGVGNGGRGGTEQLVKLVVKRVNVRPCAHVHGYLFKCTCLYSAAHTEPRGDAVTTKHQDTLISENDTLMKKTREQQCCSARGESCVWTDKEVELLLSTAMEYGVN